MAERYQPAVSLEGSSLAYATKVKEHKCQQSALLEGTVVHQRHHPAASWEGSGLEQGQHSAASWEGSELEQGQHSAASMEWELT
jgi:hypothetical protein